MSVERTAGTRFVVMSACAKMPSSCKFGRYRRYAVVELARGVEQAKMISERARGVVAIHATWEKCSEGRMVRSTAKRASDDAHEMRDALEHQASLAGQVEGFAAMVAAS